MTSQELQELVETISLHYFGRPFTHQVKINWRMTTTGGRYHLDDHHIEINAHFLDEKYRDELIGIIKHELTHYHLHMTKRGYHHRDCDFKVLLASVGGSRYAPDIGLKRKSKKEFLYTCQSCHQKFCRARRINIRRFACGKCGGKLEMTRNVMKL